MFVNNIGQIFYLSKYGIRIINYGAPSDLLATISGHKHHPLKHAQRERINNK